MLYLVRSKRLKHGPAMPQKHVAASGSINSARQATDYDKGSLVCVRAQPDETGISAMYVERGGQTWPKKC